MFFKSTSEFDAYKIKCTEAYAALNTTGNCEMDLMTFDE